MRIASLVSTLACLVLLAGCVTLHSAIVIEADGSGTAKLHYSTSAEIAEAIAEAGSAGGSEGPSAPSFDDFDRDSMEKVAQKNGVKITRFERTTAEGREGLDIELDFQDVTGLSRVMSQSSSGELMAIFRDESGNYVLTSIPDPDPAEAEDEDAGEADEAAAEADPAKAMELMGKLMSHMSELDVRMEVTVPGEVLDSSAAEVEGRTSIWVVNAANMMESPDMDVEITFKSDGVRIDAPPRPH